MEMEKYLEVLLYNVVGGITGFLSQQERARRGQLEETARGLEESYQQLQTQSEIIIRVEEQLRRAERLSALGELSAILAHASKDLAAPKWGSLVSAGTTSAEGRAEVRKSVASRRPWCRSPP